MLVWYCNDASTLISFSSNLASGLCAYLHFCRCCYCEYIVCRKKKRFLWLYAESKTRYNLFAFFLPWWLLHLSTSSSCPENMMTKCHLIEAKNEGTETKNIAMNFHVTRILRCAKNVDYMKRKHHILFMHFDGLYDSTFPIVNSLDLEKHLLLVCLKHSSVKRWTQKKKTGKTWEILNLWTKFKRSQEKSKIAAKS